MLEFCCTVELKCRLKVVIYVLKTNELMDPLILTLLNCSAVLRFPPPFSGNVQMMWSVINVTLFCCHTLYCQVIK